MKKITETSLWPANLSGIRFEPTEDRFVRGEVSVVGSDGAEIAALTPLDDTDYPIVVDCAEDVALPVGGCWELSIPDDEGGLVEARVLFRPRAGTPGHQELTADVAAWATLTVLWALSSVSGGRG
jgi:hypothetical protein